MVAMVLLHDYFLVAKVIRGGCQGIAKVFRWLVAEVLFARVLLGGYQGITKVLLGGCKGVVWWLLGCCYMVTFWLLR